MYWKPSNPPAPCFHITLTSCVLSLLHPLPVPVHWVSLLSFCTGLPAVFSSLSSSLFPLLNVSATAPVLNHFACAVLYRVSSWLEMLLSDLSRTCRGHMWLFFSSYISYPTKLRRNTTLIVLIPGCLLVLFLWFYSYPPFSAINIIYSLT